ncbi:MAG: DNA-binding protein, partial [Planctomycetota bacterium]
MAKPFYSMEEVCELLGKSEDDVKALVRDGTLREFRDAGKVFFKAEDVDKLSGARKEDTGEITLEPADDELPDLSADVGSGGTSVIGLAPVEDDEAATDDKREGTVISASGIGVFDDDELEIDADPMAATQITTGATDQVSLEGTGSGSGLLDLTRESDDTTLGSVLQDEILPGEDEFAAAPPAAAAEPIEEPEEPEAEAAEPDEELTAAPAGQVVAPVAVAAGDPTEGAFAGLQIGSLVLLVVAGSVA